MGVDPYINVVTAQTTLLSDQQTLASLHMQAMTASVPLIEALGGGWDSSQLPTPAGVSGSGIRRRPRLRGSLSIVGRERAMIGDAGQYQELVTLSGSLGTTSWSSLGVGWPI